MRCLVDNHEHVEETLAYLYELRSHDGYRTH